MSDDCANTVNCTGNDNEVHVCAVKELIGKQFVIPSYQRGYRWGDTQVQQLFDDLKKAYVEGWDSYNLQPLVVVRATNGEWRVVDGQQRLTSLYLLLKALKQKNEKPWTLSYETRCDSKEFLENMGEQSQAEATKNPDYYHMYEAWKLFLAEYERCKAELEERENAPEKNGNVKSDFSDYILEHAQFIWYPPKGASEEVLFKRLNSGKIQLSNAELIKATLFDHFGATFIDEWNAMEHVLQKEDFWAFVNPDPDATRFEATHLDFLFELWIRLNDDTFTEEKLEKRPFLIYENVTEKLPGNDEKNPWNEVREIFRYLCELYEDRRSYHLLGFLMRNRSNTSTRFEILCKLIKDISQAQNTREKVLKKLRNECANVVINEENGKFDIDEMTYATSEGRKKIHNMLLLFNLALMERETIERARFPFDAMLKATWSLEHIHAQNEKIDYKSEKSPDYPYVHAYDNKGEGKWTWSGIIIEARSDSEKSRFYKCEKFNLHRLGNMALLDTRGNSSFNDGTYLMKRQILSNWMHGRAHEKTPEFVPLGTWLVFGGLFDKDSSVSFVWTTKDAEKYEAVIQEVVERFVTTEGN